MSYFDKLPLELVNKIVWMSVGAWDLDYSNKKKKVTEQLKSCSSDSKFYLYFIDSYEKTPELEMDMDDYSHVKRIPRLDWESVLESGENWHEFDSEMVVMPMHYWMA